MRSIRCPVQVWFQDRRQTESALRSYANFSTTQKNWSIPQKIAMHSDACIAWDQTCGIADREAAWNNVCRPLRGPWGVSRNGHLMSCEDIFGILSGQCLPCSRTTNLSLAVDLFEQSNLTALAHHFTALRTVKVLKSGEYPYMPALKLSHFFNPALFPIYDTDVIWSGALNGCFRLSWKQFNEHESRLSQLSWEDPHWRALTNGARDFVPPGIYFCLQYVLWANELIRNAHDDFMRQFAEFLFHEGGEDARTLNERQRLDTFFAAAFEMLLIGAMAAS